MMINKKAQNVSEYAIIVSLVAGILLAMAVYFQRGIKVIIKEPADHLGGFGSGMFSAERIQEMGIEANLDPKYGRLDLINPTTTTIASSNKVITSQDGHRRLEPNDLSVTTGRKTEFKVEVLNDEVLP